MICFPNAKINLGLNVVRKRPDGYHDIETIFYPIPVTDALEIIEADHLSFNQTGLLISGEMEKNLVIKAYRLLEKEFKTVRPLEVNLLKSIPFGAGLGGGSSDAAFMLKLVNDIFKLRLSVNQLEERASIIGADCPFFIQNKPVFATGTGNIFENADISLAGKYLVLAKPDVMVSTPEAYANITPTPPSISLKEIIKDPISEWKKLMKNDFEESVFIKYPIIGEIKEMMYQHGALYASMSGSGSSVFGLFDKPVEMRSILSDYFVWEGYLA